MRFETHMDEKRNHTRAEGPAGRQEENCLMVPCSLPSFLAASRTNSRDSEPLPARKNQKHCVSPTSGDGSPRLPIGTRPARPLGRPIASLRETVRPHASAMRWSFVNCDGQPSSSLRPDNLDQPSPESASPKPRHCPERISTAERPRPVHRGRVLPRCGQLPPPNADQSLRHNHQENMLRTHVRRLAASRFPLHHVRLRFS
jgi:hypothetical protein